MILNDGGITRGGRKKKALLSIKCFGDGVSIEEDDEDDDDDSSFFIFVWHVCVAPSCFSFCKRVRSDPIHFN